ncbi:C25 family cysteine peptidase [Bacteroidota bacterium]
MKKIICTILFLFICYYTSSAQNYNWITPNQTYLKMYVVDDGIYRINKIDFTNAGINPNNIDPRKVKVYYKGNQVPIYFEGEDDGNFDDNDFFDFYGDRNYGGLTNTYDDSNVLAYVTDEYYNLYSDTNVYWIGWGGAYGLRFLTFNYSTSNPYSPDFYYEKLHFEKDSTFSLGEKINNTDYRNFNTDKFLGEGWYWSLMQYLNTITDTFSVPLTFPSSQSCGLRVFAYPSNRNTSIYNEHKLVVKVNSIFIDTLMTNDFNRLDTTIYFSSSLLTPGVVNNFSVQYRPPSSFNNGEIFFDLLEIAYPHKFEFNNNEINIRTNSIDTVSKRFFVKGYYSSSSVYLYDVKNGMRITNQTSSSDTLYFTGKGNGKFEIVNKYITKKPFRIKQKQVPNLVSTSNGADYLVVYNGIFESQVEYLRSHRNSHDGFIAVKAEIEDVYDVFNYGIEDPIAVRNFVKYVYDNWQLPQLKYLCLFGRGSLDPKKNAASSVYYNNFIPVYGNPPTDGYFANFNYGTFTYYNQISVGRIPAYTINDARFIVNKIIAYDNNSLTNWIKEPVFITSGFSRQEQIQFMNQSNSLINNYINNPPISSIATKVYRNDSAGYVSFNFQDSIKNSINRGGLIVNYIGHAGFHLWDYGLEDPNTLSNGTKLPLVFSMTCYTGQNAETYYRSFGEKFMYLENKGSIGFIGTTGWSFSGSGNTYNGYLFKGFAENNLRRIGDIQQYASELMSPDSLNPAARHTINCYNLLGDPASKLLLSVYPEFDIQLQDYELSNSYPSINEDLNLNITPKNLGTNADSCKIRFQLLKNNQNYQVKDTVVYNFGYIVSIDYVFSMDTTGNYVMNVILDSDNWYTQESEINNVLSFVIPMRNVSYVPLKPIDNSVIRNDTIELIGLNPNINRKFNALRLLLQFDTTNLFNSSLNQTYFNDNITGVVTKFRVGLPLLDTNITYYWRTNAVINNDSTGWSGTRRFIYNPLISFSKVRTGLQVRSGLDNILNNFDSIITVYKKHAGQYSYYDFNNALMESDSIKLNRLPGNLVARSHGENWWDATYMIINNVEFYLLGQNYRGLNIGKVRKTDGKLLDVRNYKLATSSSSDSVVNFLGSFDSTNILMLAYSVPSSGGFLSTNAKSVIKSFGSIYVDSVTNVWYRWSFISYQGLPNPIVSEAFNKSWVPTISSMQPEFQSTIGTVTHKLGPAEKWKNFSWDQVLYPNSNIKFDVIGINRNDQEVTLMSNVTNNSFVDLQGINAYQYPNMKLITKLSIDTINGNRSPVFKSLKFNYIPPAELVVDVNSLIFSDSVINDGDSLKLNVNYYNVGFRNLEGHVANWFTYNTGQKVILKTDTIPGLFYIDSMKSSSDKMMISSFSFGNKFNDLVSLDFETLPLGYQNDYYSFNNTTNAYLVIKNSPRAGKINVYSDGVKLIGGEYVRTKPEIVIQTPSEGMLSNINADTTILKIVVNNNYVPYYIGKTNNTILKYQENSIGVEGIQLNFYPTLPEGENNLKFILKNSLNNISDTATFIVYVSNDLQIKDLYNFPNPMKNQTSFMFNLAGSERPEECKIKIYTVSGRLVKIISTPVNIGYNQILWDGRDIDGDALANGVYLYKMIIEGNIKTETAIQKLVVLR